VKQFQTNHLDQSRCSGDGFIYKWLNVRIPGYKKKR
jgi:hypothetical protein